ncbi:hypothetical protein B0H14DRAFT_2618404 [Mycena olivaceomarginata]|nr:hypothetical protein B0H14DRAFT_2618404 [Mycena olivaceomarginata]
MSKSDYCGITLWYLLTIIVQHSEKAKEATEKKMGTAAPNQEDIADRVQKGDEPGAAENILFVSLELVGALRGEQLTTLSLTPGEIGVNLARHRLLYSITLIHELVHCIIKHLFSANFTVPHLPHFETESDSYNGDAGATFEWHYLGFLMEVVCAKGVAKTLEWLWKVDDIVGRFEGASKVVEDEDLPALSPNISNDTHVRYHATSTAVEADTEDVEELALDPSYQIFRILCPPQTAPKLAIQWTVHRRYGGAGSLTTPNGMGQPSTVDRQSVIARISQNDNLNYVQRRKSHRESPTYVVQRSVHQQPDQSIDSCYHQSLV